MRRARPRRPNFVFLLADDLGWADLGCYGGRARAAGLPWKSCSPALDRMARGGLRFTQAYANSPVCSPTRIALMTGRWQHRLRGGADEPIRTRERGNPELGLPPAHPTLPGLLAQAGYATALVGKWHLGFPPHFHPLRSGYQEFFGPLSGAVDYFTHRDSTGAHDLWEGEEPAHAKGYLTDLLSARAVRFLRQHRREPFFLSVHYTAPHWPWETRRDRAEARRLASLYHFDGGSVATYLAMIRHMDEGIGRILAALRETGVERDTLVVFTSDNGGERYSDTWPLAGKKMDLLEGGIRVPLIVRWPGTIPPGAQSAQVTITMDWVATILEAAGVDPHPDYPLDGASLLGVLRNPRRTFRRELFWKMRYREQKAMRAGRWKYLSVEGHEFLFDLARDLRERANLARREPARLEAMRARHRAWESALPSFPDASFSVIATKADLALPSMP
jgi:arylsulfatase A-like enzyme